ncbi:GtrA family protein [Intrasporangium flavum]|uniref:GtrA family protein n=1 Tax=Intrasporangium flavum TaxID=1428657 RepID=UPI0009FA3D68|nr:GtrA family protein [Intrasporangium flavum]
MRRLHHFLFVRHRHNWVLLFRFGVVGLSGVLVNMLTLIVVKKLGPDEHAAIVALGGTEYHVRWYHVYSTIAFLVANLWNFQLNRTWTFRTSRHARWMREYLPFLAVGLLAQVVGLVLLTLLMHPNSALHLPESVFDNSTGFRTRLYWAQLIVIAVTTPVSFVLNKLWTFAAVRTHHPDLADPSHAEAVLAEPGDGPGEPAGVAPVASGGPDARA